MSNQEETVAEKRVVAVVVAGTIVAGMFLPIVTAPIESAGLINPIWGSVYGVGFAILQAIFGLYRGGILGIIYWFVGFIAWPALVAYFLLKVLSKGGLLNNRASLVGKLTLFISLIAIVPIPTVQGTLVERLPIFTKYIDF